MVTFSVGWFFRVSSLHVFAENFLRLVIVCVQRTFLHYLLKHDVDVQSHQFFRTRVYYSKSVQLVYGFYTSHLDRMT